MVLIPQHSTLQRSRTLKTNRRSVRRVCWGGSTYCKVWEHHPNPPSLHGKLYFIKVIAPTLLSQTLSSAPGSAVPACAWAPPLPHSHPAAECGKLHPPLHSRLLDTNGLPPPLPPILSVSPSLSTPNAHPSVTQQPVSSIHQHQLLNPSVDEPSDDYRLCFQALQLRSWTLREWRDKPSPSEFLVHNRCQ